MLRVHSLDANEKQHLAVRRTDGGQPSFDGRRGQALVRFVRCLAVVLDLRLTGLSFTTVPVSQLSKRILPWTTFGFVIVVLSGVLLLGDSPLVMNQSGLPARSLPTALAAKRRAALRLATVVHF